MSEFLMVTVRFDNNDRPRRILIPKDKIFCIQEETAPIGGCEVEWMDGETHTLTHVKETIDQLWNQRQGERDD